GTRATAVKVYLRTSTVTKITNDAGSASRRVRIARFCALAFASLAAVTCDLVTAPKPGDSNAFVFALTSNPKLTVGTPLPIELTVKQNGVNLDGARFQVTSDHPNVIDIVNNDDFTHILNPLARGTAIITVKLLGSAFGDVPPSDTFAITAVAANLQINTASVT